MSSKAKIAPYVRMEDKQQHFTSQIKFAWHNQQQLQQHQETECKLFLNTVLTAGSKIMAISVFFLLCLC